MITLLVLAWFFGGMMSVELMNLPLHPILRFGLRVLQAPWMAVCWVLANSGIIGMLLLPVLQIIVYPFAELSDQFGLWRYNRKQARIEKWRKTLQTGWVLKAPVYEAGPNGLRMCVGTDYATVTKIEQYWITMRYDDGQDAMVSVDVLHELDQERV